MIGNKGDTVAIEIDFEMAVDPKGYRIDHGRIVGNSGPGYRLERGRIIAREIGRSLRLRDFPKLYLEFVKAQTPETLLGFVNRFGRLMNDKFRKGRRGWEIERQGDDVRLVLSLANTMSAAFETMCGHMGNPPKWRGGKFEYNAAGIEGITAIPLPANLSAALANDPATGRLQLQLRPPTLLDAIWLQFGQAITSNADLKQCQHCGKWFEAGAGTRRRDAKFCSIECKTEFHSLERSR